MFSVSHASVEKHLIYTAVCMMRCAILPLHWVAGKALQLFHGCILESTRYFMRVRVTQARFKDMPVLQNMVVESAQVVKHGCCGRLHNLSVRSSVFAMSPGFAKRTCIVLVLLMELFVKASSSVFAKGM